MNPFRDALDLHLRPSRQLRLLVIALHAAALAVVAAAAWRLPWLWLLLPPIAIGAAWQLGRLRDRAPARVMRVQRRPDGSWRWERADGRVALGALRPTTVCTPCIVLLHLRPRDRRDSCAVPILRDSVDDEAFRRLRAQLRLHGAAPE